MTKKALVVTSGGMDSTTALYWAMDDFDIVESVSFHYGQKHKIELERAKVISRTMLGIQHQVIELPQWSKKTALTDDNHDVPEGHYAHENMKQTVVPNRNSIMLNVAAGVAMDIGADHIVTGVHAGDHAVYPDCRPQFIGDLNQLLYTANEGFNPPVVLAPFVELTKADIATKGYQLGVPFELTWSCYKGGVDDPDKLPGKKIQCGRCSTCVERIEAFYLAGVEDTTPYADTEYWKEVVDQDVE